MPPWLWPMIETRRPAGEYMVRIAETIYSPATWMSPLALSGSVTAHQGMPAWVTAGS